MRWSTIAVVAALCSGLVPVVAVASATDGQSGAQALEAARPSAAKATVSGKWVQLGRRSPGEEVELERKRSGGAKLFAKVKTDARGNYIFRAVPPGTYRLSIGLVVETAKIEGKKCTLAGFNKGLSVGGTDRSGREVTLMIAEGVFFTVKAGARVTKDIVFSCR
jgi:hypothetical protein